LIAFARRQGWLKAGRDFSFRECYSDLFFTYFSQCRYRQAHSTDLGRAAAGKLDVAGAFAILRDHGTQGPAPAPDNLDRPTGSHFEGRRASMKALCVHASGLTAPSQTTGSMVAELRPQYAAGEPAPATIWCTGTAAPCLSLFKPCFVSGESARPFPGPDSFPQPGARADDSLWWRHERVHRAALETSYSQVAAVGLARRAELEQGFVNRERELFARAGRPDAAELGRFSRECFAAGDAALDDWISALGLEREAGQTASPDAPAISRTGWELAPLYRRYRRKLDRAAGFSFTPRSDA
jgi:hypothetical protein